MKEIDIEEFYKFIDRLGLRFPNAAITKATGYSKGNVSAYLSKTKVPSENFVKAVYSAFSDSSINVPLEKAPETSDWLQRLDKLIESNDRLTRTNEKLVEAHIKIMEEIKIAEPVVTSPPSQGSRLKGKTEEMLPPFGGKQGKNSAAHQQKQTSSVAKTGK